MDPLESIPVPDVEDLPTEATLVCVRAIEWKCARTNLLALPMGAPDFRKYLNVLSESEDALNKAVTAMIEGLNNGK